MRSWTNLCVTFGPRPAAAARIEPFGTAGPRAGTAGETPA